MSTKLTYPHAGVTYWMKVASVENPDLPASLVDSKSDHLNNNIITKQILSTIFVIHYVFFHDLLYTRMR